ncbi:hypothetical protein H0N99_00400 [Candidatus Micrarchaeota archaeon]|nr:hypothetical protein [Candidatus Micrarchaeota archaeon]
MSRAFIFTLDAILAIILCTILFFSAYSILSQFQYSTVRDTALFDVSADVLTSLEKNNTLRNAIYYSRNSDISAILSNSSSNVCSDLVIYSSDNKPLLIAQRADCKCTGSRSLLVRSFIIPNSNGTLSAYFAKMEACYK